MYLPCSRIVREICEVFVDLKLAIRQDLGFIPSGNVVLSSTYVGKILGADQLLVILCYRYQESGIGYWILSMTISGSGCGVSSWRGSRVDGRSYLLSGAIDGSKVNEIIQNPKWELESSCFTFDLVPLVVRSVCIAWVHEDDVAKTVFLECVMNTLKVTAMPFGLTNAPAVFIELISRSKEEYESHVRMIVESLKDEKMYVKFSNNVKAEHRGSYLDVEGIKWIVREICEVFVDLKLAIRQDLGFIPSGNVVLSSTYVGKILGADQLLVILCYRYQESGIGYWILSMTISGSGVTFLPGEQNEERGFIILVLERPTFFNTRSCLFGLSILS
ncbi:hypothetical protein Tco_0588623 [Tanacetum coccineum]